MKLKILSLCSIASLLCGESVFAEAGSLVDKYQVGEYNKLKRSESTPNLRKNLEHKDADVASDVSGRSSRKMRRSESTPNLRKFEGSEEEEAINFDPASRVPTDVSAADKTSAEPSHSFALFERFNKEFEEGFSKLESKITQFKQDASIYSEKMSDPKVSVDERKNISKSFNESRKNLISKLDKHIANLKQLQNVFANLRIDEKIKQVEDYQAEISELLDKMKDQRKSERRDRKDRQRQEASEKRQAKDKNKRASYKTGPIDWDSIKKYNEDLSNFVKAVQNHKLRFNVVLKYGDKCLNSESESLFDTGQEIDPNLKGLCAQIYEVRFPEAIKVWSDIKKMNDEKDPNYKAALEELRSKVLALGKNVSNLVKQKFDESYRQKNADKAAQNKSRKRGGRNAEADESRFRELEEKLG